MIQGFKDFLLRGNVVDLAVAVVIGAAFTTVIDALVKFFITPLIAAIFGKPDISQVLQFTINSAQFSIGAILQAILNFLLVALAVYFIIVVPMNKLMEMRKRGEIAEPEAPSEDVLLLTQIRDLLGGTDPSGSPRMPGTGPTS